MLLNVGNDASRLLVAHDAHDQSHRVTAVRTLVPNKLLQIPEDVVTQA
jgi:hypothetical protein